MENTKPQNFRDFNLYFRTSKAYPHGKLSYLRKENNGIEGITCDREVLSCEDDYVDVYLESEILNNKTNTTEVTRKKVKRFTDFEEFSQSSWYRKALDEWGYGLTDSSWMDCDYVESDDNEMYIEFKYGDTQTREVHNVTMCIEKLNGSIDLTIDGKTRNTSIKQIINALEFKTKLGELGIHVEDGNLTIPLS